MVHLHLTYTGQEPNLPTRGHLVADIDAPPPDWPPLKRVGRIILLRPYPRPLLKPGKKRDERAFV